MPLDDRAVEALGHLQRAMLEMIQAARAALDLVEDFVADPQSLAAIVANVGQLAQAVVAAASAPHPGGEGPRMSHGPQAAAATPADEAPVTEDLSGHGRWDRSGIERIPVGWFEPSAEPESSELG